MKKIGVILFVLTLLVCGRTSVFAHDYYHRIQGHHHYGHHGYHHGYHGHHGYHHGYHGHHGVVVVRRGYYYPDPYSHYNVDGTALVLGTAILGASLVNGVVGAITSPFTTPFIEGTKRLAITEDARTKREEIRASTVSNAPNALGGSGSAEYASTEGSARISASTPRPRPASREEDVVKECSKEQLKAGRVEWGTSGKLKNLKTGKSCFYMFQVIR